MNKQQILSTCLLLSIGLFFLTCFSCKNDPASNSNQEALNQTSTGTFIDTIIAETSIEANKLRDEAKYSGAIDLLKSVRHRPDFREASANSSAFLFQRIGVMYFLRGDFYSANDYLDSTITIRTLNNNSTKEELAQSYFIRSGIRSQKSLGKEALEDIQIAISLVETEASKSILIEYYQQLADVFQVLGDLGQAEYYYQKCLDLNNGEKTELLAMIKDKLGNFYGVQGKHKQQLEMYQEALDISKSLGLEKTRNHFVYESNFGNYFLNKRELDKAQHSLLEVLKELEKSEVDYFSIHEATLNNLAMVEMLRGEVTKARPYYAQMLDLSNKISTSPYSISKARAYEGLGDVDTGLNKWDAAITNYHKAIKSLCIGFDTDEVYASPSVSDHLVINHTEVLRILQFKADALLGKYKASKDIAALKATMDAYQYLDQLMVSIRQQFKTASSRYNLIANNLPIYEKGTQVALQLYEATKDQQYLTLAFNLATKNKAVVLQEGLQDEQAKFAGIPAKILTQENALKKERYLLEADIIEIENSTDKKDLKEKRNKRFKVIRNYEKLITQLEKDYPKYHDLKHQTIDLIDPKEIIRQLPAQTALIDFFVGRQNIYIFSISEQGLKHYVLPRPKKLNALCTDFRMMFQNNDTPPSGQQFSDVAYKLYQTLLEKPLADLQNQSTINRLIIIPDDYLLQISFDGLLTQALDLEGKAINWSGSNIPYLLRQYAISYAYSNRILFDQKAVKRTKKAVQQFAGFGLEYDDYTLEGIGEAIKLEVDTALGRGMGKLFHSVEEVSKIKAIIGKGSVWKNTAATKKAFLKNAPKASILHLAMHGFETSDSPLNAGLIFARKKGDPDFILKAADLYALSLSADMTVLSACNTATGAIQKGEGVRSLARAFQYTGCNSLVATLWSISDHTTKEIMIDFYGHLKDGTPKDVALQKAKMDYLKTAAPSQAMPFYWTNVVTIGDARALSF